MERRIDEILGGARDAGKTVLTPYLCAGFPDNEAFEPMLAACGQAGCSLAIIGLAHRGAIVEGTQVAAAMASVVARGTTIDATLEQVRRARAVGAVSGKFGLVAAASASMMRRDKEPGPGGFMSRAKAAGLDAVLAVDVPLEEAGPYRVAADEAGVQFPMLVSTTTPQPRMAEIAKVATGFLLLLSRAGGAAADLANAASRLSSVAQTPILIGWDIATAAQVRSATEHGDGVVVAGPLTRRVANATGKHAGELLGEYVRELSAGLSAARPTGGAA